MESLVKNSLEIFETSDEWSDFVELANLKSKLLHAFYNYNSHKIVEHFKSKKTHWDIISWGTWDYKWFLTEYGTDSVCLWQWGNEIGIHIPNYDSNIEIQKIANNNKYNDLRYLYQNTNPDKRFYSRSTNDFQFDNNTKLDYESIAWYIKNRFDEYIFQLDEKVGKLLYNEQNMNLLYELNREIVNTIS